MHCLELAVEPLDVKLYTYGRVFGTSFFAASASSAAISSSVLRMMENSTMVFSACPIILLLGPTGFFAENELCESGVRLFFV